MSICLMNITIGMFAPEGGNFIIVRKRSIEGMIGQHIDKFFSNTNDERNCNYIGIQGLGKLLENGSFTGKFRFSNHH